MNCLLVKGGGLEPGHVVLFGAALKDGDKVCWLAQALVTLQDVLLDGGPVVSRRVPPAGEEHKLSVGQLLLASLLDAVFRIRIYYYADPDPWNPKNNSSKKFY